MFLRHVTHTNSRLNKVADKYGRSISWNVAQVIRQEYENTFEIYVNKEKLVNISSGVALDDHRKYT